MGLDITFLTFASKDEVAYLRKHQLFSEMVFNQETPPIWSGYTDFLVYPDMVEAVATWLELDESEVVQAEAAMSETDFESCCWAGDEDRDLEELLPVYRRVIQRLRAAIDETGPLICAWSA
ncbi:hypothetical protein [Limimaricola soesokkakensis]|uniref:hypothetical protein n=1 Tax=Limimaricola soesokkakensis TaxID=1343159 RepID=UPI003519C9FA